MESNHRPPPYQGGALPTELRERNCSRGKSRILRRLPPCGAKTDSLPLIAAFAAAALRALHRSFPGLFHRPVPVERANGAGDGNRTRTSSLEGYSSTIELLPPGIPTKGILTRLR